MSEKVTEAYQSFLLRCWQVQSTRDSGAATWRFALRTVSAEPNEQYLNDLEHLMEIIAAELHIVGERQTINSNETTVDTI